MNDILPKKSLKNLTSYRPQVNESKDEGVIRLSVNEGALGPSPLAIKAIKEWSTKPYLFHRYPNQLDENLILAIKERYNLIKENIVLGNGSDDLIQLICNAFLNQDDEAIYTEFGFLVFPQSIKIAGGVPVMAKDKNYTVDIEAILESVSVKTKIIFVANPNNPTGTMIPRSDLMKLISKLRSNILLVIDSAYAEYVERDDYTDGSDMAEDYNNIIMLRTFSKIHGLASLRLGWAYCNSNISNVLKSIRAPFSVNDIASAAGSAAVQDIEFQQKSIEHNKLWKNWTIQQLTHVGIEAMPSEANFFLINLIDENKAIKAIEFLEKKNIFVRGMKPYSLESCIRVSIGNELEMRKFVSNLVEFQVDKKYE